MFMEVRYFAITEVIDSIPEESVPQNTRAEKNNFHQLIRIFCVLSLNDLDPRTVKEFYD